MPAMPAPMMTTRRPLPGRQRRRPGIGRGHRQQAHRRHGVIGRRDTAGFADQVDQRRGGDRLMSAGGAQRRRQRAVVQHVERAADRHALGRRASPSHRAASAGRSANAPWWRRRPWPAAPGSPRSRRLRSMRCKQWRERSGPRADAGQRRQGAAEHVIQAVMHRSRAPVPRDRRRLPPRRSACDRDAGRLQIAQGSRLSRLPHRLHGFTARAASASAVASGSMRASGCCSIFSAARRALRGPRPGSLASRRSAARFRGHPCCGRSVPSHRRGRAGVAIHDRLGLACVMRGSGRRGVDGRVTPGHDGEGVGRPSGAARWAAVRWCGCAVMRLRRGASVRWCGCAVVRCGAAVRGAVRETRGVTTYGNGSDSIVNSPRTAASSRAAVAARR